MNLSNDRKRPNSNSGNLAPFLRGRERMIHTSVWFVSHPAQMVNGQVVPARTTRHVKTFTHASA